MSEEKYMEIASEKEKDKGNKVHKRYIDYLRVLSMLSVVMIHVCSTALTDFDYGKGTVENVLFVSVRNILHFAVPVFFMITGALLLNPAKDIPIQKLLKHYILKYACVILIFAWGYSLIEIVFNHRDLQPIYFFQSFTDMLQGKTWAHMWYMYSLLSVLLVLPILRWTAKFANATDRVYLLIVLGLCLSVVPFIKAITGFGLNLVLPITSYTFLFLLLGYWIDQSFIHIKSSVCLLIIVCNVIVQSVTAYFQVIMEFNLDIIADYSSPFIIIYSIALFALIKNFETGSHHVSGSKHIWGGGFFRILEKAVAFLSHCSFGVYLVHMFWINLAYKFLHINPYKPNAFLMMLVVWITTVALSVITTLILKTIPCIRKLI